MFFSNLATTSNCIYPAAVFSFTVLLMLVIAALYAAKQKKRAFLAEAELLRQKDRLYELEELVHAMAQLGKMSFFVTNINNRMLSNSDSGEIKLAETYMTNMLPADRDRFRENCQKLFSGAINSFNECYTLIINGNKRRHLDSAVCIKLPGSTQKKVFLIAMDVTQIEEQNINLANADSILAAIFDNLPGHIFLKNISSDFTYERCNPSFSGLLQKNPSDLIGKSDFDLFDRSLAARVRACDLQVARTGNIADNRWFFVTPDGKEHAIRFIIRTLKRSDGSECLLGFGVDVTRQEYIAKSLRKRNKELRALISQLPLPAILWNSDLSLACSTTPVQKKLSKTIVDRVTSPINCAALFNCNMLNTPECAACKAAAEKQAMICPHAVIGNCQLAVKALFNENDEVSYYYMHPASTLNEQFLSRDQES